MNQLFGLETSLAASIGVDEREFNEFLSDLKELRDLRIAAMGPEFGQTLATKTALWVARFS